MKPFSEHVEQVSDKLSRVESRRGVLRLAAKVTAAIAVAGGSLTSSWNSAGAYYYRGCNLAFAPWSGCPTRCANQGQQSWVWGVCYGGCLYQCYECYNSSPPCSAAFSTGNSCGSGGCQQPRTIPD